MEPLYGARQQLAWVVLGIAFCLALPGCGGSGEEHAEGEEHAAAEPELLPPRKRHDPKNYVEVDFGEFFVARLNPEGTERTLVRFRIYGVAPETEQEELTAAVEKRGKRMRDAVIAAIQRTDARHLKDPRLGWIKSELVSTINTSLRCQALRDVVFSDFALIRG